MLSMMQEKRPLKRPRLGPPDVYPQEAKQKEDELTSSNVKHGFEPRPLHSEEFGTARNCNVTASKVGAYFNAILARREELMTLSDSGRKKQQINPKDNFWPVTVRSKAMLDVWFKDLAGNKPLISLAKKAPSFNKKEEIFTYLCDNQVSMQKAAWFIKLSSAYTVAVSEAKIKKRQMPDPATEWTGTIIKFMKDLIPKLQEQYHQGPLPEKSLNSTNLLSTSTPTNPTVSSASSSSASSTNVTPNTVPPPMTSPASSIHSPAPQTTPLSSSSTLSNNQTGVGGVAGTGSIMQTNSLSSPQDDFKLALKQWQYCTQLCKYMYEEGLLDRHEFLNWVLDLLDKMRTQPADDGLLKLFLPMTMQYMSDFVLSERLSRRLAYLVCKKLAHMLNSALDSKEFQPLAIAASIVKQEIAAIPVENLLEPKTENIAGNNDVDSKNNGKMTPTQQPTLPPPPPPPPTPIAQPVNPLKSVLDDYLTCPHHRDLLLEMSGILHVITLNCPTALVWCGLGENRAPSALVGSPLDHLPIPPSNLSIPNNYNTNNNCQELQTQLKQAEENIKCRSKHAEAKWCTDKWQNKNGNSNAKILTTLDALDNHCFERMDTNGNNNLEALYAKIFPIFTPIKQESMTSKNTGAINNVTSGSSSSNGNGINGGEIKEIRIEYNPQQDAPIVQILCEWAVSWQRWGEHRAMAVAWLLDKRQSEVTASTDNDGMMSSSNPNDDKESIGSANCLGGSIPIFQTILMNFLDHDAPIIEENSSTQQRSQFTNLVHLFSELIRHDVFSHDAYMCTLISRGDLLTGSNNLITKQSQSNVISGTGPVSNKPSPHNSGGGGGGGSGSGGGTQSSGLDDDMFPGIDFKPKMEEFDDSNVDDDLDKILQNIKEDQQNAIDAPDSPKDSEQHQHG